MHPAVSICALLVAAVTIQGSASVDYSAARTAASGLPQLHSLLVSHQRTLVLEHYAPKHSATRLANIKSASKSIISTLVGIAIERKLIPSKDEPITRWFPEVRKDPDRRKASI